MDLLAGDYSYKFVVDGEDKVDAKKVRSKAGACQKGALFTFDVLFHIPVCGSIGCFVAVLCLLLGKSKLFGPIGCRLHQRQLELVSDQMQRKILLWTLS